MGVAGSRSRSSGEGRRRRPDGATLRFTLESDHLASRRVQKKIMNVVRRHGHGGDGAFAIRLALEEALANAIKHGNKLDRRKKVRVEAQVTPRRVRITVEDEGRGFDPCCVPDPTLDENLEKCCGRGLLLIGAYMDRVRWSRGGRRLTMIKQKQNGRSC